MTRVVRWGYGVLRIRTSCHAADAVRPSPRTSIAGAALTSCLVLALCLQAAETTDARATTAGERVTSGKVPPACDWKAQAPGTWRELAHDYNYVRVFPGTLGHQYNPDYRVDPRDPCRVYRALATDYGSYRVNGANVQSVEASEDGGASWQQSVAAGPPVSGTPWPVMGGMAITATGSVVLNRGGGGAAVVASDDHGRTWTDRVNGLPGNTVFRVATAQSASGDGWTGYAVVAAGGVASPYSLNAFAHSAVAIYATHDSGNSWQPTAVAGYLGTYSSDLDIAGISIDPADPGHAWFAFQSSAGITIVEAQQYGVVAAIAGVVPGWSVYAGAGMMVIHTPTHPTRIFLMSATPNGGLTGAVPLSGTPRLYSGPLLYSDDDAKTWHQPMIDGIEDDSVPKVLAAADPTDQNRVLVVVGHDYNTPRPARVYYSVDGFDTWEQLSGAPRTGGMYAATGMTLSTVFDAMPADAVLQTDDSGNFYLTMMDHCGPDPAREIPCSPPPAAYGGPSGDAIYSSGRGVYMSRWWRFRPPTTVHGTSSYFGSVVPPASEVPGHGPGSVWVDGHRLGYVWCR